MVKKRKELTKEADKILGLTRGPGSPSKANKEMRKLSNRAVAMVLDHKDTRPLAEILLSLQSEAAEEGKTGRGGGAEAEGHPRIVKVIRAALMNPRNVLTTLGHLVREDSISMRRDEVIEKHGGHSYNLRPRKSTVSYHPDEVDHTFECQMLAHAIFQTPEYHPILRQLDINTSSHSFKEQTIVVKGALERLKEIQNCVGDVTLFNLKMLNKSINITKGSVIKRWLNDRVASRKSQLQKALQDGFRKSTSVQKGIIDTDEADELAAVLTQDLILVEGIYVERLDVAAEMVGSSATITDKRKQKKRLVGLQDTITALQEEHMDW